MAGVASYRNNNRFWGPSCQGAHVSPDSRGTFNIHGSIDTCRSFKGAIILKENFLEALAQSVKGIRTARHTALYKAWLQEVLSSTYFYTFVLFDG